ncbi:DUF4357 domain-containing protein [Streptomyces sp. VTCC 41912]|uniref:DUF4357 domain-containing protein n=1 Tax=Streptomyces sp. VTCC 41912 TaxID=3383243 RepID=UPI003896D095
MPTLSIHFDSAVIAHLTQARDGETVHVNLTLGSADTPAVTAPAVGVPHGPLAGLMGAGLLEPGTELSFRQRRAGRSGRAVVTADGQLIVDGFASPFASPSKAAEAITGNVINGWTLWQMSDGRTLDELRRALNTPTA